MKKRRKDFFETKFESAKQIVKEAAAHILAHSERRFVRLSASASLPYTWQDVFDKEVQELLNGSSNSIPSDSDLRGRAMLQSSGVPFGWIPLTVPLMLRKIKPVMLAYFEAWLAKFGIIYVMCHERLLPLKRRARNEPRLAVPSCHVWMYKHHLRG